MSRFTHIGKSQGEGEGGGGFIPITKTTIIDLGSKRTKGTTISIVDAEILLTNNICAWISNVEDRTWDELEYTPIVVYCNADIGSFIATVVSSEYIYGKYILSYTIS